MSFIRDTRSVEQQRFFNGQRLFDSDLQGIEAFNREMRWLHNQSLHQPGIGNGFAVTGKKGDREVTIGPGYAVDDLGREIVLTSPRTIPAPPVAGDLGGLPKHFLLTVAYPEDADLEIVERRAGLCGDEGATRQRVEPILCWVPLHANGTPEDATQAARIQQGRQLVLASIAVRECKLDKDLSLSQRRNAKPSDQPYIACGHDDPTAWRRWQIGEEPGLSIESASNQQGFYQVIGGLQADINTTDAGFLTEPRYFTRLAGPRVFEFPIPNGDENESVVAILDGLVHIVNPSATGFTARVLVLSFGSSSQALRIASPSEFGDSGMLFTSIAVPPPVMITNGDSQLPDDNPFSRWSIVWMGVEG